MDVLRGLVISYLIVLAGGQFTRVEKKSSLLLSRKKRFLQFPKDSNLVMTMSLIKALLRVQPRGWNTVYECDVPFALPSDTRLLKKFPKNRMIEKRDILARLERGLFESGMNGEACVKRMICEVQSFEKSKGKSMVKDILYAILSSPTGIEDNSYRDTCETSSFAECPLSFLEYITASLLQKDS